MGILRDKRKNIYNKLLYRWKNLGKYFPPGYEFEKERNSSVLVLALAAGYSVRFFRCLKDARATLYYVDGNGERALRPGCLAEPFVQVAWSCFAMFLPLYLFLAVMMAEHYLYYHRETKSIYLMRRLPKKGVLLKSCVQWPILAMGIATVAGILLLLVYYGIYLLAMPGECLPRFR